MTRVCKVVIVCEGQRDSLFIRGFFEAAGISTRQMEIKRCSGGSGFTSVIKSFPEEVAALQRFREGRGVVGILDADNAGISARTNEIATLLATESLPPLSPSDGRCLLIAARNLETWLYWLKAHRERIVTNINEIDDYKKDGPPSGIALLKEIECRLGGETLHGLNPARPVPGCPPELVFARQRLSSFLGAVRR